MEASGSSSGPQKSARTLPLNWNGLFKGKPACSLEYFEPLCVDGRKMAKPPKEVTEFLGKCEKCEVFGHDCAKKKIAQRVTRSEQQIVSDPPEQEQPLTMVTTEVSALRVAGSDEEEQPCVVPHFPDPSPLEQDVQARESGRKETGK
ncbi:hypothetical protein CRG98_010195 [Punica granatum]|uniref:Uncharacterized protein n=1 Tax=Punica granatum TaxID=22663 RepID=A0A2I0KLL7_PUNGR|nr:hypothetical protein CRG98_010195 [Punica granatum]